MHRLNLFLALASLNFLTALAEPQLAVPTIVETITKVIPRPTSNTIAPPPPKGPKQDAPAPALKKRGIAFNDPTFSNNFPIASWAYNWASDPHQGFTANQNFKKGLKYIPMLWDNNSEKTRVWDDNVSRAIAEHGADSVLAFNEPDMCEAGSGGSCMAVADAVGAFRQYLQPYAGTVRLGAPAVTNAVGEGVGMNYLEQFMGQCNDCTIDFIPLHFYSGAADPEAFKQHVTSFHQRFQKPIWVTEFALTSDVSEDQSMQFLRDVMPWLDQQPFVERYSYFMARNTGTPFLLNPDNSMTNIGKLYSV